MRHMLPMPPMKPQTGRYDKPNLLSKEKSNQAVRYWDTPSRHSLRNRDRERPFSLRVRCPDLVFRHYSPPASVGWCEFSHTRGPATRELVRRPRRSLGERGGSRPPALSLGTATFPDTSTGLQYEPTETACRPCSLKVLPPHFVQSVLGTALVPQ